ncbi:hypothetical protein [Streptomyces sp. ME18-1-4]|uniref:hypothetical protein n=1 Tax=Streptomyces sp. ME18-1-4 TaxID=3028685 RepID=UPI0029B77ED3|nr:hypothetical protein [Streptomyces sp. ME18-1-4]MDX3241470.1 hypothetical protein [Streptomyces sp. ME18-1-4]
MRGVGTLRCSWCLAIHLLTQTAPDEEPEAEYGYPLRRMPLARWRSELPRTSGVAETTLAFFDSLDSSGSDIDLRLGRVRSDNAPAALHGSGIAAPPVDRGLVFRYLDHLVTSGALPAPTRMRAYLATPAK